MAPDHWWLKLWKKLHLSRVILVLGVMLIFSVSFNGREREKKNPSICASHPCARTMLNISVSPEKTSICARHPGAGPCNFC